MLRESCERGTRSIRNSSRRLSDLDDLTHLMSRSTLAAGTIPNTIGNLSGWIADPQAVKPGTRMPNLNLSGPELQAVRTYLETLK